MTQDGSLLKDGQASLITTAAVALEISKAKQISITDSIRGSLRRSGKFANFAFESF